MPSHHLGSKQEGQEKKKKKRKRGRVSLETEVDRALPGPRLPQPLPLHSRDRSNNLLAVLFLGKLLEEVRHVRVRLGDAAPGRLLLLLLLALDGLDLEARVL